MKLRITTPWQKVPLLPGGSEGSFPRGHVIWARRFKGDHVFSVLPDDQTPDPKDCGHPTLADAVRATGFQG